MVEASRVASQQGTAESSTAPLETNRGTRRKDLRRKEDENRAICNPIYKGAEFRSLDELCWALKRQRWAGGVVPGQMRVGRAPAIIARPVGALRRLRKRVRGVSPPDLRGATFSSLVLTHFDLPADLRQATFSNCEFSSPQADSGTNFVFADLRGTRFVTDRPDQPQTVSWPDGAQLVTPMREAELRAQLLDPPLEGVGIHSRQDLLWLAQQPQPHPRIDLRAADLFECDLDDWNLGSEAATLIDALRAAEMALAIADQVSQGHETDRFHEVQLKTWQEILWVKHDYWPTHPNVSPPDRPAHLNLQWANLSKGNFPGVDLSDADLSHANLNQAVCCYGIFERAICEQTNMTEARLAFATFEGAQAWHADFSNCIAPNASFFAVDLHGATLMNAQMRAANLSTAQLTGVDCLRTDFACADLRGAHVDASTAFIEIQVDSHSQWGDIAWHSLPILDIDWPKDLRLGDEVCLIATRDEPYYQQDDGQEYERFENKDRAQAYRAVLRAYHQIWTILREQRFGRPAGALRLREKAIERLQLLEAHKWPQLLTSLIARGLTGYGEKPQNLLLTYGAVVLLCAPIYLVLAGQAGDTMTFPHALVVSLETFRGVYPSPFPAQALNARYIGSAMSLIGALETGIGWLTSLGSIILWERRLMGDA